ncbi:MAG: FGGY family carbohydrate kinase, partial [Oscillospiraceae bacterium]|nr:FGGY family carbohydrate kinase [Oscillospiraceae bacterium]
MADSKNMLSFDFGNSTLRSILCHFDGEKITSEVILSEANEIIKIDKYFYWDFLRLFSFMKKSIEKAASEVKLDSVGICTWGIDFMLFDGDNHMLSNALCYRNSIGSEIMERQSAEEQKAMFYRTGILCDKINSIYMLKGIQEKMPSIASQAKKLLMVPDVLTYFMTGVMENEPSELSTTQL